jgi:hypothetical protein
MMSKYLYTHVWDSLAISIEGQNLINFDAGIEVCKIFRNHYVLRVPAINSAFLKKEHRECFHDYEPVIVDEFPWEPLKDLIALLEVVEG